MMGFAAGNMVYRTVGLRIQGLRANTGGEYISKKFKMLCVNSGMEYTAIAWPHQNETSQWNERFDHIICSQLPTQRLVG